MIAKTATTNYQLVSNIETVYHPDLNSDPKYDNFIEWNKLNFFNRLCLNLFIDSLFSCKAFCHAKEHLHNTRSKNYF